MVCNYLPCTTIRRYKCLLMPIYCRPYEVPWKAWEFQAVLATLKRESSLFAARTDFSNVKVSIILEKLAIAEPSVALQELQARSQPVDVLIDEPVTDRPSRRRARHACGIPEIGKADITRGTAPSAGMWSRVTPSNSPSMA